MLDVRALNTEDLNALRLSGFAEVSARMLEHVAAQAKKTEQHDKTI